MGGTRLISPPTCHAKTGMLRVASANELFNLDFKVNSNVLLLANTTFKEFLEKLGHWNDFETIKKQLQQYAKNSINQDQPLTNLKALADITLDTAWYE